MTMTFNLLFPLISVFCCTPLEANWNRGFEGNCFFRWEGPGLSYMQVRRFYLSRMVLPNGIQAVFNIITDIVYVASPILYLSTIQLSQQTRWDLRVVFCLGLV